MSFLTQMTSYFRSPALKESMYHALANQQHPAGTSRVTSAKLPDRAMYRLEKDKLLETDGFKADLYIESDDVIYLVKTIEKFQLDPLPASYVQDLIQAKKNLVHRKYKRVVPVILIGQNTQSRPFLEEVYRHHVLVLQGTAEECAYHFELILQHQVTVTYQMSPRIGDSEVRFFGI